jgi:hypothetical protein
VVRRYIRAEHLVVVAGLVERLDPALHLADHRVHARVPPGHADVLRRRVVAVVKPGSSRPGDEQPAPQSDEECRRGDQGRDGDQRPTTTAIDLALIRLAETCIARSPFRSDSALPPLNVTEGTTIVNGP